jgi:hypothetical protein
VIRSGHPAGDDQEGIMDIGIQIVWWIGLIVALLMTLAILKGAFQIIHVLRDILHLSEYTQRAASGILDNLSEVRQMDSLHQPAHNLHLAAASLNVAAEEIENQLKTFSERFPRKGG